MSRCWVGLLAVSFLALGGGPGSTPGPDPRLATTVREYVKEHDFSGVVLVDRGGRTEYLEAFGLADRSFETPTTPDTRFRIASITKSFTSTLILQLYDEGELDLGDTVRRRLPEYRGEAADRVTIRQLLNHTSGLQNMDTIASYEEAVTRGMEAYQRPWTTDQLIERFCSGPLVSEPGTTFDYNNAEYIILGKVIERLTGKTFDATLRERILEPLEMHDSGMLYQRTIVSGLAPTYYLPDTTKVLVNDLPVYIENWYAAGGMYSTASDVLKFAKALFGGSLLRPQTLELMLTPGLDQYGYGLWIPSLQFGETRHRAAQRPGSVMGANCVLLSFLDDDLTIVILSNTNTTDIDAFAFRIGESAL